MDRDEPAQQPPRQGVDLTEFPARRVEQGTRWRRTHQKKYKPWFFDSASFSRFNLSQPMGTCYLANSNEVAARESLGPDIMKTGVVAANFAQSRVVSSLVLPDPIKAAHVSTDGAFSFGVSSELCSMPNYSVTRQWAHDLQNAGFEGVWYHPRFTPGLSARALAVFGAAGEAEGEVHEETSFRKVLESMGVSVIDTDCRDEYEILDAPVDP